MWPALLGEIEIHFEGWNPAGGLLLVVLSLVAGGIYLANGMGREEEAPRPDRALPPPAPRSRSSSGLVLPPILAAPETAPAKAKKDRRSSPRRGGNPVPILVTDGAAGAAPMDGIVLDRSRGGMLVSVPQPASVGTVLSVRAVQDGDDLEWVQLEVRHCRQRNDRWLLGCAFQKEHPWVTLLRFG